jgi:hypothetical protein
MTPNAAHTGWTSFVTDCEDTKTRILHEQGNPDHRLRVEHNQKTLLVHLSDEDGHGWTGLAVDRATRRWAVSRAARQLQAAEDAYSRLYRQGLIRGSPLACGRGAYLCEALRASAHSEPSPAGRR